MQANTGVRFETKDPLLSQLVKQAEEKCRLNIKNFGGDPVLVVGGGVLQSGGQTKFMTAVNIIGTWGFGVPLGFVACVEDLREGNTDMCPT